MDGTFIDWLPDSPFRSPAWRWLRASWRHRTGQRSSPRVDDEWVDLTRRFLARSDKHAVRPDRVDTAVLGAHALSSAADPHRRWRLEALLLTSDSLETVARRCCLHPDIVEAYHALFFACRDRPGARDWVAAMAVGCGPWNDFAGPQPEGMWKYAAFSGGPVLLDVVIAVTTGGPLPESVRAACARNPAYDEDRLRMDVKLTTSLMTSQSPDEIKTLIAIHDDLLGSAGRGGKGRENDTPVMRLMNSFLASFGGQKLSRETPTPTSGLKKPSRTRATVAGRRQRTLAGSGSVI
jgi:hypothetical protein